VKKNIKFIIVICSLIHALPTIGTEQGVKAETLEMASNIKQPNINDAKQMLMTRLSSTSEFDANFSQQVIDEEKNVLQQSQGYIAVKKPNLVHWKTTDPEESLIISDGEHLWFFDPFVEQVTAYSVNTSIANTPILLLTSTDEKLWQQYSVSRQDQDSFLIHSNDINSRVKTLELNFYKDSPKLSGFTILDSTGQFSIVKLEYLTLNEALSSALFKFEIPEGVYLDDQR